VHQDSYPLTCSSDLLLQQLALPTEEGISTEVLRIYQANFTEKGTSLKYKRRSEQNRALRRAALAQDPEPVEPPPAAFRLRSSSYDGTGRIKLRPAKRESENTSPELLVSTIRDCHVPFDPAKGGTSAPRNDTAGSPATENTFKETFGALRRAPLAPFDKLRAGRTGKEEPF